MRLNKPIVRGFTLAELMLSLALLAFLMVAAVLAIEAADVSRSYNDDKTDLVTRARGVLDRLARDVRRCASFIVPDGRTITITMANGDTHAYAWDGVDGGNLMYTYTAQGALTGTTDILTDQVKSFEVTDNSPACTFKIVLKGRYADSQARITATPRKSVY
jgi:prepilin-type N-terminal cleavage/methylation domain-containing protein